MDNKFVLANREEIRFDEELTTQPIGYYKMPGIVLRKQSISSSIYNYDFSIVTSNRWSIFKNG